MIEILGALLDGKAVHRMVERERYKVRNGAASPFDRCLNWDYENLRPIMTRKHEPCGCMRCRDSIFLPAEQR
jgi:hypothetical protein